MKKFIYLKNVVTLKLDPDKCIGCGMCTDVCPHGVFTVASRKAEIMNKDACMECGACRMNCPAEAISVDVGVGCAAAIINTALGIQTNSCCCVIESQDTPAGCSAPASKTHCC